MITVETGRARSDLRRPVSTLVTVLIVAFWFVWFAPTTLGGGATYALVTGTSMQPFLHDGDLVVARHQSSYAVGDLVAYRVAPEHGANGYVIHRLVAGDAADGWVSKGDNKGGPDEWAVPDGVILGAYWFDVPAFGAMLGWVQSHPVPFAALLAALCLVPYLPWHRRRVSAELAAALAAGHREPHREGRPASDYVVLAVSAFAALVSAAALTALYAAGRIATTTAALTGAGVLISGTVTVCLAYRLYDGRWLPEPTRSVYALSGRLYRVHGLPLLSAPPTDVPSAVALRSIAEKHRLPVLHRVDKATGVHEFLLITVDEGSFLWQTAAATAALTRLPRPELLPVLATGVPLTDDLVALPSERSDRRRAVRRGRWRARRRDTTAHHQHRAR